MNNLSKDTHEATAYFHNHFAYLVNGLKQCFMDKETRYSYDALQNKIQQISDAGATVTARYTKSKDGLTDLAAFVYGYSADLEFFADLCSYAGSGIDELLCPTI